MADVNILNAMTFPLYGERLIEASAGTGKTFTIASLYLRLLLGHGGENAYQKEDKVEVLNVDQILVVTFTEAATAELRDRIRARIHQARIAFSIGYSDDPVISLLLADTQGQDYARCAKSLLAAERQMDEAAIYTIHGFCQRMLKQNAFESGALFESEFITDESQLKFNAIADFWRSHFYRYKDGMIDMVHSFWSSPQALLRDISGYLSNTDIEFIAKIGSDDIEQDYDKLISSIQKVKDAWLESYNDLCELIQAGNLNGNSYRVASVAKWLNEMLSWSQSETKQNDLPDSIVKFSQQALTAKTKKGKISPEHQVFSDIDTLLEKPLSLKDCFIVKAVEYVRARVMKTKNQSQLLSFDDLLSGLSAALTGEQAVSLAECIRSQYPVAMIDEFQDTDQQQYDIFNTIYGKQDGAGLFMIGDPKQAIYSFRGADIFTYMQARENVDDHYTLAKNWRSSTAMVSAVNCVFEHANKPFIYEDSISFQSVESKGKSEPLLLNGLEPAALQLWLHEEEGQKNITKGLYQQVYAKATANQIATLLTDAQQGNAMLAGRAVKAGDIAILVRTGAEAKLVREQLDALSIPSVYMSNRESVFATREARELYHIFAAILNPEDEGLLRAALATSIFEKPAIELDQLSNDEKVWEQTVAEFKQYQNALQWQGFLPALRLLLNQQNIAAIMLSGQGGDRRLTDVLHLGELLQEASLELDGEYSLFRWFGEKIENPNGDAQEQLVRLESEADLVQVVTIHKSKGLEYNLVFLPFICATRQASAPLYHAEGHTYVHLDLDDEEALETAKGKADQERLAEDLRLLYVALTRGVYATWLGLGAVKMGNSHNKMHLNAIGYLLQQGEECKDTEFKTCVEKLAEQQTCVEVVLPPLVAVDAYQPIVAPSVVYQAKTMTNPISKNWWVTSYSALSRHSHGNRHSSYDASLELPGFDAEVDTEKDEDQEMSWDIFSFPRGAAAGTLLHTVFEHIDFSNVDKDMLTEQILHLLEREGYDLAWLPVLLELVNQVLDCPLLDGFSLRQLTPTQKKVEMEFFMPISSLNCDDLNTLIKQHDGLSQQAGELDFQQVSGMLKGFIDLVFVYEGRYYVLDYKSNHLGDSQADYTFDAINQVMIEHRYELQYQLYTLALHRFLRSRIPDYNYEQHFGGVYYLFLRGMQVETAAQYGVFFTKPSVDFVMQLDDLFLGELA
ncbi:exodeoxyribonuclease V subunit beta [Moritella viscosa]|uniref:RecBCD enzyme subunit RecB n=1 Tax=Moritella viscosa TaxID=80854 RepID=A0ABY1HHV3_9GAMM|nr:exodeoxyribonuclease V subunit beta [Moritella viscosa]CED58217.1 exodeoxyribonuclease V beta chain [Moritella viscosa]SGY94476.1 Putative exodeoxyribonuclease V [Moritella viscosa]SGZ06159.1 Putative exodeoxyribonuclease V [Moritella viscosa]SHO10057.1 Putative exodeoxyribonuclease V [Moritella viscosa]SHO22533.1 Putative exodeoxyribonuclease V [Moritella viscosa]